MNAVEYIGVAEGLKSKELALRSRIEGLENQRAEIRVSIDALEYRIDSLYAQIAALEAEADDEDGPDNSAEIASIRAQISAVNGRIRACRQEESVVQQEIGEQNNQLRAVMDEQQDTLAQIQELAEQRRSGMIIMSGISGLGADSGRQAASAFNTSLGKLAQAAQILGGSVTGGNVGGVYSGISAAASVMGNSGYNLYEKAAAQRAAGSEPASGGAGARHMLGASRPAGLRRSLATATYTEEPEQAKPCKSGLGQKMASVKNSLINQLHGKQSFSGFPAQRNPYQKGAWDIVGSGYDAYCAYRDHSENYTYSTSDYGRGIVREVDINSIEGIPHISDAEIKDPRLFWGRESGKNKESFLEIASRIPEVKGRLQEGVSIDTLLSDPELGSCAAIYFCPDSPGAPTLTKGDGFYEFGSNGRHRILAARHFGYSFPMRITGEIVLKNRADAPKPSAAALHGVRNSVGGMGARPAGLGAGKSGATPAQSLYRKTTYSAPLSFTNPQSGVRETVRINRTVYENRKIDPALEIPQGTRYANGKKVQNTTTNLELMKEGKAPFLRSLDPKGKEVLTPVELHHLSGRETITGSVFFTGADRDGSLAEVGAAFHDKNSRVLHLGSPSFRVGVAGQKSRDSAKYNAFRKQYWKHRAEKLEDAMNRQG